MKQKNVTYQIYFIYPPTPEKKNKSELSLDFSLTSLTDKPSMLSITSRLTIHSGHWSKSNMTADFLSDVFQYYLYTIFFIYLFNFSICS